MAGLIVCTPSYGASAVGAATEAKAKHNPNAKPTPAPKAASALPSPQASQLVWPSFDGAMPVLLRSPAARESAGLFAPSYAGWLVGPSQGTPPGGRFVARGLAISEIEVLPWDGPGRPPSPSATSIPSAVIVLSAPLPPKRLAEKRAIVMASFAPLPPKRLIEPDGVVPPAIAALEEAVPEAEATPGEEAAGEEAAGEEETGPAENAARPIDDAPEPAATRITSERAPPHIEALIERHAARFDVPARLVRRVAWRESKFNPASRHGPYWGLMQIRVDTARGLGFRGAPKDLLDADTNMTYAVAYLANAYRVAGRDEKRAVMLYARGYYYEAKRKGMLGSLIRTAAAEP